MRIVSIFLALLLPLAAWAQYQEQGRVGTEPGYTAPRGVGNDRRPMEPGSSFRGEIKAIDRVSGTVTLRHGPIQALFVREGTSEYPVKESSLLEGLKVGDAVRFTAVLQGRSVLVTNIGPTN